jgi:hypothetical protein
MNATYRPQEHAAALTNWEALLMHQSQEIAALRGDVTRLLHLSIKPPDALGDPLLNDLVRAAFKAMGSSTWIVPELLARTLRPDSAAMQLQQAITATGKGSTRELGKLLAGHARPGYYSTPDGLELRRSGFSGNLVAWTIAQV